MNRPKTARRQASRIPRQERSRLSRERILDAAERVLADGKATEFTLLDVSRASGISIGGIYRRFADKDDLVVALQERLNVRMTDEFAKLAADASRRASTLERQIAVLVAGMANLLRRHAPLLRTVVETAMVNTVVARNGVEVFHIHRALFKAQLLKYRRSISQAHPEQAIDFCFNASYELVASHFGFGRRGLTDSADWPQLIRDLQRLCVSFLTARPARRRRSRTRAGH